MKPRSVKYFNNKKPLAKHSWFKNLLDDKFKPDCVVYPEMLRKYGDRNYQRTLNVLEGSISKELSIKYCLDDYRTIFEALNNAVQ